MLKADVIISQHSIRDASVKTALNPVKNLNDVTIGYSGELQIGPAIIEFDRLGQLIQLIDNLTNLQELWSAKSASIVRLPL